MKNFFLLFVGICIIFGEVVSVQAAEETPSQVALSPITSDAELIINVPARELLFYHQDQLIFRFPVAVGSPVYKTPIGDRALTQIVWNPWWFPPNSKWARGEKPAPPGPKNPLGPVKMELGGDIRLHGTNKESSVGHPVSHGCMRMRNADAVTLAWWIQSHLTDKTDGALLEKYKKARGSSFYVTLPSPIPVHIQYNLAYLDHDLLQVYPDFYGRNSSRESDLLSFLEGHGLKTNEVYQKTLDHLLEPEGEKIHVATLKELFPGTLNPNPNPLPDPFETSWHQKKQPSSRRYFSFLFHRPPL